MIGETGERKSAVATPDGKSRKKKKIVHEKNNEYYSEYAPHYLIPCTLTTVKSVFSFKINVLFL